MRRYTSRYGRQPSWRRRRLPRSRFGGGLRRNLDVNRLSAFRRRRNTGDLELERLSSFRRNPDPDGKPWGPTLYDPLEDKTNKFKDETHYKKVLAKLYRRNPMPRYRPYRARRRRHTPRSAYASRSYGRGRAWSRRNYRRNPYRDASFYRRNVDDGLFNSLYQRRSYRRNPWTYRSNPGWSFTGGKPKQHDKEFSSMYHRSSRLPRPRYRRNRFWEGVKDKANGAARVAGRALTTEGPRFAENAGRKLEEWGASPYSPPLNRRMRRRNPSGLFPDNGLYSSIYSRHRSRMRRNPFRLGRWYR